jgi:tetratricopeptide (TPR) repeat protein
LQLARGLSLFTTEGFISSEAAESYTRASELAGRGDDRRQQFMAVYGLWQSAHGTGAVFDGRRLSDRLLKLTQATADEGLRLQAHHSAWAIYLLAGELLVAREHCEAGRRLYDPDRHRSHLLLYGGHDPGVCAGYNSAQAHWLLGYPEQALAMGGASLALAEQIAHSFSREAALQFNALLRLDRGEPEIAVQLVDTAEALADDQRLALFVEPRFLRGAALSEQGAFGEAVACLREGLASRLGGIRWRPYGLGRLAEALAGQREHAAALAATRQAMDIQERTGQRRWRAELHRLEGIALLGLNRLEEAQSAFEEALRVARRQQAKSVL